MVAIRSLVKGVFIQACQAFIYKDNLYKTVDDAVKAHRLERLEKLFPNKSSDSPWHLGYSASDINRKWDELVEMLNSDIPVKL